MIKNPKEILKKYWGHEDFRGSQEKVIHCVLDQEDVLALMPTGGGKSICYQIPALVQEGICIVVSPLVALIQDQVAALRQKGIKAVALSGGMSENELIEKLDNCVFGNYKFLYLSPERLQQEMVQNRIQEMNVNLIAIDEAHCISQWGHDFRPSYLQCSLLRNLRSKTPCIALTATATRSVSNDIITNLGMEKPKVIKDSFSRKNIAYQLKKTEDKHYWLRQLLDKNTGSAIVYTRTRRMTKEIAHFLTHNGFLADFYHGGLLPDEKRKKLQNWSAGTIKVMVATNAFGMGIDKADVRVVIHFHLPANLENYFQEAGRAGRDGKAAKAILLTNEEDQLQAKKQFVDTLPTVKLVKKVYKKLNSYLQIAYHEGYQETFFLNFAHFCSTYEFKSGRAYAALKVLDQHSIVSMLQSFREKTNIQFLCSKTALFNYLEKNPNSASIIQHILRTYGGVFDYETKIDLAFISKKTNIQEHDIRNTLNRLKTDGLIRYEAAHQDLEISFLVPREDDQTINNIAGKLKSLNQNKLEKFDTVLQYVTNTTLCRSVFLLNYFDEKPESHCGICDICTKKNEGGHHLDEIKKQILDQLETQNRSSKELIALLPFEGNTILKGLRELLEDENIVLDHKNTYGKR